MAKRTGATKKKSTKSKSGTQRASTKKALAAFCRSLPHVTEDVKWGDNLCFSVAGKLFTVFHVDSDDDFGFKCDEEDFLRLIQVEGIIPAPYAARYGWVGVRKRGALKVGEAKRLIRKSYDLVVAKLPAKKRRELGAG